MINWLYCMSEILENSLNSILVVLVLLKINKQMIALENALCDQNLSLLVKNEHSKIVEHDKVAIVTLIIH